MKKHVIILLLFTVSAASRGDFIYDVDFEPPTFTDGALITTGPGPGTPSFALGVIDANLGSFSSQAAFLSLGGQMEFGAPGGVITSGINLFSFEATMIDAVGPDLAGISVQDRFEGAIVGVIFDTGTMRVGSVGNFVTLPYVLGTPSSFSFVVDLDTGLYSATVNGSPVLQDISFASTLEITDAYFNTGAPNPNASMGVDNFQWQLIPEPSTFILVALGMVGLLGVRWRRS